MVLEQVKAKATEYLKSKGLTGEDVGRVIGIFFFAKYLTFFSMIPVCYKFRPLRRFLTPLNVERGKAYFAARRGKVSQSRMAAAIRAKTKSYQDWMKSARVEERKHQFQNRMQLLQREARQFVAQKREEQRKRLREKLERRGVADENSWIARINRWTEKIASKVAANESWKTVALSLKVPPKDFAFAVGEGLVFYKLTSPIWMPVELFGIVKYLQWRRRNLQAPSLE